MMLLTEGITCSGIFLLLIPENSIIAMIRSLIFIIIKNLFIIILS